MTIRSKYKYQFFSSSCRWRCRSQKLDWLDMSTSTVVWWFIYLEHDLLHRKVLSTLIYRIHVCKGNTELEFKGMERIHPSLTNITKLLTAMKWVLSLNTVSNTYRSLPLPPILPTPWGKINQKNYRRLCANLISWLICILVLEWRIKSSWES